MKEYEFNPNDIEHCLERADALKAKEEGRIVQILVDDGRWIDRGYSRSRGFEHDFRYRRKPTPVARAWSQISDVPGPHCWLRHFDESGEWLITGITNEGIAAGGVLLRWHQLKNQRHSKTRAEDSWQPCTTPEP